MEVQVIWKDHNAPDNHRQENTPKVQFEPHPEYIVEEMEQFREEVRLEMPYDWEAQHNDPSGTTTACSPSTPEEETHAERNADRAPQVKLQGNAIEEPNLHYEQDSPPTSERREATDESVQEWVYKHLGPPATTDQAPKKQTQSRLPIAFETTEAIP